MATTNLKLGKGTVVEIAMLPSDSRAEPTREATITLGAAASAGATSLTVTALSSGVLIPKGSYLAFTDSNDEVVLVQLDADAEATDTTLTVIGIPADIANAATSTYPLKLGGRTSADLGRSGNRVSSVDFDSDGYSDGLTTSIEQTITASGNFLPEDAGLRTADYAFREFREDYVWLTLAKNSTGSTTGERWKGAASITNLPMSIPADGIITADIDITFNGKPEYSIEA